MQFLHEKDNSNSITDDCMLLENFNYTVRVLEGNYTNIKVTTLEDIILLKHLLEYDL